MHPSTEAEDTVIHDQINLCNNSSTLSTQMFLTCLSHSVDVSHWDDVVRKVAARF